MRIEVVTASSASKRPLFEEGVDIDDEATVLDLKKVVYGKKRKYYVARQRFTLPPEEGQRRGTVMEDDRTLKSYGIREGSIVHFKDLGPQVGYTTVFFWEYFGPLTIYPLFYLIPQLYWWNSVPVEKHVIQTMALCFWTFHYAKRLLETFFVHRFSHGTMPLRNLFKNCSYYWGFSAYVSYFVNHPLYLAPSELRAYALFFVGFFCELGNLRCHIIQRNLRAPGEKGYKMPHGFLFEYFTCANYTMEMFAWLCFSIATQTFTSLLFTVAGTLQMAQWAAGKHKRLQNVYSNNSVHAHFLTLLFL